VILGIDGIKLPTNTTAAYDHEHAYPFYSASTEMGGTYSYSSGGTNVVTLRNPTGMGGTNQTIVAANVASGGTGRARMQSNYNLGAKIAEVAAETSSSESVVTIAPRAIVEQTSTTGTVPTLELTQSDLSEEFIQFNTTVATGNPVNTTALGAYYGRVRVSVNGTFKWLALYD